MFFTSAVVLSLCSVALARPINFQRRAAVGTLDTGSCGSPEIEFANGLDGRKEPAFQPVDQDDFDHGSALNIKVIADFVCGQLQSKCKASVATVAACEQGTQDAAQATDGAAADAFNAALGITSGFAAGAADSATESDSVTAGSTATVDAASTGSTANATTTDDANANSTVVSENSVAAAAALDTGSCGSPEIQFADGLDGRNEPSFEAVNQDDFPHGSALNIGIIANFVCQQLKDKCKASADTLTACDAATQDAASATGGAAADAFNAALGITSDFAADAGAGDGSAVDATARDAAVTATDTGAAATNPTAASSNAAVSGDNLQTFTGTLGAAAPAVTASGGGTFQVDHNASFNNLQNALVRSCDVQHNQCANAANASGNKGDLTVAACGSQQDQCNAEARTAADVA